MHFKRAVMLIQHAIRNRKKKTAMMAKLAIAMEEAMMDEKNRSLRERVSVCSMSGCGADEKLLLEVESLVPLFFFRESDSSTRSNIAVFLHFLTECWII